jgi:hypothetical protein
VRRFDGEPLVLDDDDSTNASMSLAALVVALSVAVVAPVLVVAPAVVVAGTATAFAGLFKRLEIMVLNEGSSRFRRFMPLLLLSSAPAASVAARRAVVVGVVNAFRAERVNQPRDPRLPAIASELDDELRGDTGGVGSSSLSEALSVLVSSSSSLMLVAIGGVASFTREARRENRRPRDLGQEE